MAVVPLTSDKKKLDAGIKGMKWARGFTNMAQAFTR